MNIRDIRYPICQTRKEIAVSAMTVALLVYLFLTLFQPFGTYNYRHTSKYLLLLPYAAIAFSLFYTGDRIISRKFTKWTWKNEISKTLIFLFLCSMLNYWYSIYFINDATFSLRACSYMVLFTYILGVPVCTIAILGKYSFLKEDRTGAITKEAPRATEAGTENNIAINPDVGEGLVMLPGAFLYARSEGNYSTIFFKDGPALAKKLLRISLKDLEAQICDDNIIRCHRSYILNIGNTISKKGNAQGFKVSMRSVDEKIPVSRKYIDKISGIPF